MTDVSEVNTVATIENEAGEVEMKDATTNTTKGNAAEGEVETYIERITGLVAAAGIETKIENYDNIRTQRRHYSEVDEAEVIDLTTNEIAVDAEGEAETEEEETTRKETEEVVRVENKRVEDEIIETVEAARVEKKEIEDCEGVRSHRKHFPGSTTSNIFR